MNNTNHFHNKFLLHKALLVSQSVKISGISIGAHNLTQSLYERYLAAEHEKRQVLKAALDQEFPSKQTVSEHYVTEQQANEMKALIETLTQKYDLSHIICFARKGIISNNFSVFADIPSNIILHYFLLFISKGAERVEHEIQHFINTHYQSFKVTAIAHNFEAVRHAIAQGNRFFIAALVGGITMYHDNHSYFDVEFPKLNPVNTLSKAEQRFHSHIRKAAGFLNSGIDCIRHKGYYENGVFMLHQAVEQACIALIKIHMGYRIDLHNLTRLLNLCRCFTDKPAELFFSEDEETTRLFKVLQESYGQTRYSEEFTITETDAISILERVDTFITLAGNLCLNHINTLRVKVGKGLITNEFTINDKTAYYGNLKKN